MFSQADGYEQFMGRWSRRLAPRFVEFAGVSEGDRVLDVGSGTGAVSFAAEAIAATRVIGVDAAADLVRSCRATERVRFETGDAMNLRFDDDAFDRTLSMLVLNFMPDPAAALRQMVRVTSPGGVVAAAVWDYGDGMQMLRAFWDEAVALTPNAATLDERNMPLCTAGALSELWRHQALDSVEERTLTIETVFTSFDDYWQPFLRGQGPAGAYVASLNEIDCYALQSSLRRRFHDASPALRARAWAVRGVVI